MQTVTASDVEHGWLCESCHAEFRPGDNAYGIPTGMTADGTPIEGDWSCLTCWTQEPR